MEGTPIRTLELGRRAKTCLEGRGVKTVEELINFCGCENTYDCIHGYEKNLRGFKNLGSVTLVEIRDALARRGLKLMGHKTPTTYCPCGQCY